MANINKWEDWDEIEDKLKNEQRRDKVNHKNSKTDKQKNETGWKEPQKLVYRKKKK